MNRALFRSLDASDLFAAYFGAFSCFSNIRVIFGDFTLVRHKRFIVDLLFRWLGASGVFATFSQQSTDTNSPRLKRFVGDAAILAPYLTILKGVNVCAIFGDFRLRPANVYHEAVISCLKIKISVKNIFNFSFNLKELRRKKS